MTYIFPDLSIDINDDHIQDHIESGHYGQNGQNGPNGRHRMKKNGHKYSNYWCLWKDQEKCRSPMKTELKKQQRFKSYGQINIRIEIMAIFLCILAQIFNELEGPLRMLRIS